MVAPAVAAALISSAASLGGAALSTFGRSGGGYSGPDPLTMSMLNYQHQKEFAQNAIQWRVADAKAAGLHPLAALGASPLGFSPSFSGAIPSSTDWDFSAMGDAIGKMGQNIGRAVEAQATEKERADAADYANKARELDLENKQLQNDTLRQNIVDRATASVAALAHQAGQPPAMQRMSSTGSGSGESIPGQAQSYPNGLTENTPAEVISSMPGNSHIEAGVHPDVAYDDAGNGTRAIMRSDKAQNALEDDEFGSIAWNLRNRLLPSILDVGNPPPASELPDKGKGKYGWTFNPFIQAWVPYRRGSFISRFGSRFNPAANVK